MNIFEIVFYCLSVPGAIFGVYAYILIGKENKALLENKKRNSNSKLNPIGQSH